MTKFEFEGEDIAAADWVTDRWKVASPFIFAGKFMEPQHALVIAMATHDGLLNSTCADCEGCRWSIALNNELKRLCGEVMSWNTKSITPEQMALLTGTSGGNA